MSIEYLNVKRQQAFHYFELHKFKQAIDIFYEVLSEDPNDGEILYYISMCFYQLDILDKSIEFCLQAMENNYDLFYCNKLMGLINNECDKLAEAERYLLEALRIDSNNAGAFAVYSYIMLKAGQEKKAKSLLDEAIRLEPYSGEVLHYAYLYYMVVNQKDNIKSTLARYFESGGNELNKFYKAGMANYYMGNLKSAKEELRQAFLLEPQNKDIYSVLRQVERESSIALIPLRLVDKVGGPAVFWVIMIVSLLILRFLKADKILVAVSSVYILYAIYSWVVVGIFKLIDKKESQND